MNVFLNELKTYPEIKRYKLINLLTKEEFIVTEDHLEKVFGDKIHEIKSNRNNSWYAEEIE